jgi:hypothetical protein
MSASCCYIASIVLHGMMTILSMYAGKSVCLESIAFACGEPAHNLRLKSLDDLRQGQEAPNITVEWSTPSGHKLTIHARLDSKQGRRASHPIKHFQAHVNVTLTMQRWPLSP